MRYLRYTWSALLLVAAILSPDVATAITLLVAGLLTVSLAVVREQRMQTFMRQLSATLPFTRVVTSSSVEREMLRAQRSALQLAVAAELLLFVLTLAGRLDITVARNYALLVLVALAPLGLELQLTIVLRTKHTRLSETAHTAIRTAQEDAWALLLIIGLSLGGTLWLHIPPALSALQILLLTCLVRPLLSGRNLQAAARRSKHTWQILLMAAIVYGSFVFYFIRNYIEPRYADAINPIVWQAMTVATLTAVICMATNSYIRASPHRTEFIHSIILLSILVAVIYGTSLQKLFMTSGLPATDWVWAVIGGTLYSVLIILVGSTTLPSGKRVS